MDPQSPDGMRRPAGLWLLTVVLLTSPAIHALALFFHTRWVNFGSHHPWDAFVYFVIAPVVGALMLRRHERARSPSTSSCPARSCVRSESNPYFWVSWRRTRLSIYSFPRHAGSIRRSTRARWWRGCASGRPRP